MMTRGSGRILNTASVAGFRPSPGFAVYAAKKAFVLSYTEVLATELEESGVTATALYPGATDTDFFAKADMTLMRFFQQGPLSSPQEVADGGHDTVRGDCVTVIVAANKAMVFARRFMPIGPGQDERSDGRRCAARESQTAAR